MILLPLRMMKSGGFYYILECDVSLMCLWKGVIISVLSNDIQSKKLNCSLLFSDYLELIHLFFLNNIAMFLLLSL